MMVIFISTANHATVRSAWRISIFRASNCRKDSIPTPSPSSSRENALNADKSIAERKACFPLGVPPDLKSGVKKGSTALFCGFEIRSKGVCFSFYWGITNPPLFIGRTFFNGGLQIRRNAQRDCDLHQKNPLLPHNPMNKKQQMKKDETKKAPKKDERLRSFFVHPQGFEPQTH